VANIYNLTTHLHGAKKAYSVLRIRYGLDRPLLKSPWGASSFSLLKNIQDGPPIQRVPVFFLGVKLHGHAVDNSHQSSAAFRMN
jgi:hypothetical protein